MKYLFVAVLILGLMVFGCAKKAQSDSGTNKEENGKGTEALKDNKKQVKAVCLGDSLFLLLEKGKMDKSNLVVLDTGDTSYQVRDVIAFDMKDRTDGDIAKAKAENITKVENEAIHKLKITFDAAYAIKEFLGDRAGFVDVRTPGEYEDGHAKDAELIPLDQIETKVSDRFEKDDVITLYCRSGNRSGTAQSFLGRMGYFVLDIGGIGDYKGTLER